MVDLAGSADVMRGAGRGAGGGERDGVCTRPSTRRAWHGRHQGTFPKKGLAMKSLSRRWRTTMCRGVMCSTCTDEGSSMGQELIKMIYLTIVRHAKSYEVPFDSVFKIFMGVS